MDNDFVHIIFSKSKNLMMNREAVAERLGLGKTMITKRAQIILAEWYR